jgi:hypothetical protein
MRLDAVKGELSALEEELSRYGACDPTKVEKKRRAVTLAKEAAVRWTGAQLVLVVERATYSASLHSIIMED